jgi:hypothetical protein
MKVVVVERMLDVVGVGLLIWARERRGLDELPLLRLPTLELPPGTYVPVRYVRVTEDWGGGREEVGA